LGQRHVPQPRDFLHAVPERLFEADTGLVAGDHDRAFDDGGLHDASPSSSLCWSKRSPARSLRRSSRTRSALVRPNSARLVSACFAACSRSLRFLNRFRLITSTMFASIIRRLEGMIIHWEKRRVVRWQIAWSFGIPVSHSLIASKNMFRSAKTE